MPKPFKEFPFTSYTRKGRMGNPGRSRRAYCDVCARLRRNKYWKTIATTENAKKRRRYNSDPKYKDSRRHHNMLYTYGMGLADYKAMHLKQKGRCAICKRHERSFGHRRQKKLYIDHNHVTGVIRGLLCYECNYALGQLNADKCTDIGLVVHAYLNPPAIIGDDRHRHHSKPRSTEVSEVLTWHS
jgi:recombination endonuclease VII